MTIAVKQTSLDFSELHARMKWYVDEGIIPYVNSLVLQGDEVVDLHFYGNLDKELHNHLARMRYFACIRVQKLSALLLR